MRLGGETLKEVFRGRLETTKPHRSNTKPQRRRLQQQKRRAVVKEIFYTLDTRQLIGEIVGNLMQWHGMSEQEAKDAVEAMRKQQ